MLTGKRRTRRRRVTIAAISAAVATSCIAGAGTGVPAAKASSAQPPSAQATSACGGPSITATTTDSADFAGIFSSYAESHPAGDTSDWIGGDTDYSVTLPSGIRLWDFTDAQLGTINSSGGIADNGTAHNVAVEQEPDNGALFATLHSSTAYPDSDWYLGWIPEPSTEDNTTLHTPFYNPLAMEVEDSSPGSTTQVLRIAGIFGDYSANDQNFVATYSLPSLTLEDVTVFAEPQPGTNDLGISWGDALIQSGRFTYVYGRSNPQPTSADPYNYVASAYLARVPDGDLGTPADWSYYTGLSSSGTPEYATNEPSEAEPVVPAGGTYPCETGVVPSGAGYSAADLDGTYYIFTRDPNSIGSITAFSAPDPWGPFSGPDEQDPSADEFGFYTMVVPSDAGACASGCAYGPHIQADVATDANGWLLSYDLNSATLADRDADASLYWPRYLRIQVPLPALAERSDHRIRVAAQVIDLASE